MSKQSVKTTINDNIKQNGHQEITGPVLNSVLNEMVDNLAEEASTTEKLTELSNKLGKQVGESQDLSFTLIDGHGIYASGDRSNPNFGKELDVWGDGPRCTDFVSVEGFDEIIYLRPCSTTGGTFGLMFYDESKTAIRGQLLKGNQENKGYEETTLEVPENATYVRVTYWSDESLGTPYLKGSNVDSTGIYKYIDDKLFGLDYKHKIELTDGGFFRFGTSFQGVRVNIVPTPSTDYKYAIIEVNEGDVVKIKGNAPKSLGTYCLLNEENKIVRRGLGSVEDVILVVGSSEKKLLLNNFIAQENDSYYSDKDSLYSLIIKSKGEPATIVIAAADSTAEDKYHADLVCTGSNDQNVINTAIEALVYGGTVKLCGGTYYVDNFNEIADPTFANGGIAIGMKNNGIMRHVVVEGTVRWGSSSVGGAIGKSVTIKVSDACYNSLADDKRVCVFGVEYGFHLQYYSYCMLSVRNLKINMNGCAKPIVGVSFIHASGGECYGVNVYNDETTNIYRETGKAPTPNSLSIGFLGYASNNSNYYTSYQNSCASGCGVGFEICGDFAVLNNCWTGRGLVGFSFGYYTTCTHNISLINCMSGTDNQPMRFGDKAKEGSGAFVIEPVFIINFQIERGSGYPDNPEGTRLMATEVNPNSQWCGEISYVCQPYDIAFFEEGHGHMFKVRNMRSKMAGTYSQAPLHPNYLEEFWDTENNRKLIWDGSTWRAY